MRQAPPTQGKYKRSLYVAIATQYLPLLKSRGLSKALTAPPKSTPFPNGYPVQFAKPTAIRSDFVVELKPLIFCLISPTRKSHAIHPQSLTVISPSKKPLSAICELTSSSGGAAEMVCSAIVSHGRNVDKHIQVQLLEQTPRSLAF